MKIKYAYELELKGLTPANKKFSGEAKTLYSLTEEITKYRYLTEVQKTKKISKYLSDLNENEASRQKFKKLDIKLIEGKKTLVVKTKKVSYDDEYIKTDLYYHFHVYLRKGCDSKAAWGLWQFLGSQTKLGQEEVVDLFFKNLIYCWRRTISVKKYTDIKKLKNEELVDLAKKFKKFHFEEMDADARVTELLKNDKQRQLWFILLGLYEGIPDSEVSGILYSLAEIKLK